MAVEAFKALYHASLLTQSHAAFYRLPLQKSFHGIIASQLTDLNDASEGFIIGSFDANVKTGFIPNEISFSYHSDLDLNFNVNNQFSDKFKLLFDNFSSSLENREEKPYYSEEPIHISSSNEFIENIEKAKEEIINGRFKKTVLSRVARFNYQKKQTVIDIFFSLAEKYPNAFISLISSPIYGTWIGASPEIFLQQRSENYSTVALAGTKKKDSTILFTGKEKEEQNIIKEYIEGTLKKENITYNSSHLEHLNAGELIHLKTTIEFIAPASKRLLLAELLHPTPAVGGFPKDEAIRFILENEYYKRKIYAGYIGPISKDTLDVFVNIRCMQWRPEYALVYAGAGITLASNANLEWEETENKLHTIAAVL